MQVEEVNQPEIVQEEETQATRVEEVDQPDINQIYVRTITVSYEGHSKSNLKRLDILRNDDEVFREASQERHFSVINLERRIIIRETSLYTLGIEMSPKRLMVNIHTKESGLLEFALVFASEIPRLAQSRAVDNWLEKNQNPDICVESPYYCT